MGHLSHELRTPLNSVLAYGSSILDGVFGEVTPSVHRAVTCMVEAGMRLHSVVDQVLDASSLASEPLRDGISEVDYASLSRTVVGNITPAAIAQGLSLSLQIPEGLPQVKAEPDRLEKALIFLLQNAIKFTEHGGVTVSVSHDGQLVHTEVSDTGIGIALEEQKKVFSQYYQVNHSLTRKFGGAGLGLFLAERFLSAMGSLLTVESKPGHGSTFRFTLPAV